MSEFSIIGSDLKVDLRSEVSIQNIVSLVGDRNVIYTGTFGDEVIVAGDYNTLLLGSGNDVVWVIGASEVPRSTEERVNLV